MTTFTVNRNLTGDDAPDFILINETGTAVSTFFEGTPTVDNQNFLPTFFNDAFDDDYINSEQKFDDFVRNGFELLEGGSFNPDDGVLAPLDKTFLFADNLQIEEYGIDDILEFQLAGGAGDDAFDRDLEVFGEGFDLLVTNNEQLPGGITSSSLNDLQFRSGTIDSFNILTDDDDFDALTDVNNETIFGDIEFPDATSLLSAFDFQLEGDTFVETLSQNTVAGVEQAFLTGNDRFFGGRGIDAIGLFAGLDSFVGYEGDDRFNGGEGMDIASFRGEYDATNEGQSYAIVGDATQATVTDNLTEVPTGVDPFDPSFEFSYDLQDDGTDTLFNTEYAIFQNGLYNFGPANGFAAGFNEGVAGDEFNRIFASVGQDILVGLGPDNNDFDGTQVFVGLESGDFAAGGFGSDEYIINGRTRDVTIVEGADPFGGSDTMTVDRNATIMEGIEVLRAAPGTQNIRLNGDDASQSFEGNNGRNRIDGEGGSDSLFGNGGRDRLDGGLGDDFLDGGDDRDRLDGDEGSDFLDGGDDRDRLRGGDDNDTLIGGEGDDRLDGDDGDDSVNGGGDDDRLRGGDGNDILDGGADDDRIRGDDGNDFLFGGSDSGSDLNDPLGDDDLRGGRGDDTLAVGSGFDTLRGDQGTDTFFIEFGLNEGGFVGINVIEDFDPNSEFLDFSGRVRGQGVSNANQLILSEVNGQAQISFNNGDQDSTRDDLFVLFEGVSLAELQAVLASDRAIFDLDAPLVLTGDADGDLIDPIEGFGGNDNISGLAGDDVIDGGNGQDTLLGGSGDDVLSGGNDDDSLDGGDDDDILSGNNGDDTLIGGDGLDILDGGDGDDLLEGGDERDNLDGGDDDDTLDGGVDIDVLFGGDGDDSLIGGVGGDDGDEEFLSGGTGNDTLDGGEGFDILDGGSGQDLLNGGDDDDDLDGGTGSDTLNGDDGDDELDGGDDNDSLVGGAGDDILVGDSGLEEGDDTLEGGEGDDDITGSLGNDILLGDAGEDVLSGGDGDNTLTGGSDFDTFNFVSGELGDNVITDFTDDEDVIGLSGFGFTEVDDIIEITVEDGNTVLVLTDDGGDDDDLPDLTVTLEGFTDTLVDGDFIFS